MSTKNTAFTANRQDAATPAYERVNGTSWWGAVIVGLVVAVSLLFTGAPTSNNLAPLVCLAIMLSNYASLRRVGDNFTDRADRHKTLLGFVGIAILFIGCIIWGKLTVTALFMTFFVAAVAGVFTFALAKFLLPSIQKIKD